MKPAFPYAVRITELESARDDVRDHYRGRTGTAEAYSMGGTFVQVRLDDMPDYCVPLTEDEFEAIQPEGYYFTHHGDTHWDDLEPETREAISAVARAAYEQLKQQQEHEDTCGGGLLPCPECNDSGEFCAYCTVIG